MSRERERTEEEEEREMGRFMTNNPSSEISSSSDKRIEDLLFFSREIDDSA